MKYVNCAWLLVCAVLGHAPVAAANPVAGGWQHTVVATPAGTVWTWGGNGYGQLGDGTNAGHNVPAPVPLLTGVTAVAAGTLHTLALKSDGSVWAWGYNGYGQLGDGTTTTRLDPVPVGGLTGVIAIAAGDYHSVALTSNGSVWTWGANTNGQLGDGTTTLQKQPIVIGTFTATAIGTGASHTLVVKTDGSVWAWGANASGQLGDGTTTQRTSPVQMTGVTGATAVAGGGSHSLLLKSDGTVRAVGSNFLGQLGDGTTTQRTTSVAVSGLTSVTAIAAGQYHSNALESGGSLRAWGRNGYGELGDGTTTNRSTPVSVSGMLGVAVVASGASHVVAATSAGVVSTWGYNTAGQLGDGTTTSRSTPGAISDVNYAWKVGTPVFSVAAGTYTTTKTVVLTCATPVADIHYTSNGDTPTNAHPSVLSGGSVSIEQTQTLKARAYKTAMPQSDVASATYTLAVASIAFSPTAGTYSAAQSVALSTTSPGATIRYTLDGTTPTEASALYSTPLAIGTSTTVKAAGFRSGWSSSATGTAAYTMNFGTLAAPTVSPGAGTYTSDAVVTMSALPAATIRYTTNGTTPTTSSPAYTGPVTVAASGTLKAKAFHPDYTTSPETAATYTILVAAPTVTPTAGTYPAGQTIAVATATTGATITYTLDGSDPTSGGPSVPSNGTLVMGNFTLKVTAWKTGATPSAIVSAAYQVTGAVTGRKVAAGDGYSLLIRDDAVAWSWGLNANGQLGDGTSTTRKLPVLVSGLTGAAGIAAGDLHSMVLRSDGTVLGWGSNLYGRLGDGTQTPRLIPTLVPSFTGAVAVAAAAYHSVALKSDGTVWAWGYGAHGQIGDGTTTQRLSPVQVNALTSVTAIAARGVSSLALKGDGTVWSWGGNGNGQLGDGTTTSRSSPAQVTGITTGAAVAFGGYHALALLGDGTVKGWGYNFYGQVGDGTGTQRTTPVTVSGLSAVAKIAAGGTHSLALSQAGVVWAWGYNGNGQIGDGTTINRLLPVQVSGLPAVAEIVAGGSHSIAIAVDGSVWAWGRNADGQVGDGTITMRTSPVEIAGPGVAWKIATPVLSLVSGLYTAAQTVTVTCTDGAAVLHYTIDGTNPTEGATVIASGGTLAVGQSLTLKVRGWKPGAVSSEMVTGVYELKVIAPALSPASGRYATAQSVTMSSATPGATFTYTTDGTEPGPTSTAYSGAVVVSDTRSIKARAYKAGWTSSDSTTASYWISGGTVATPTISSTPAAGPFASAPLVALACVTSGATIRYTLDGTDPTDLSARFEYPFMVVVSATVKAKAFKAGFDPSATAVAGYALDAVGQTSTPIIIPGGGRFAAKQTVAISGPAGATLRYTTTGVDPIEADTLVPVNGQVVIASAQILKVRAWATGSTPSVVRRADFVITGAVAAGHQHSLGLAADGTVWAWGRNTEGQAGDGTGVDKPVPVAVLTDAAAVSGGQWHSLAARSDGTVRAWGDNFGGQLGDGTTFRRLAPVTVSSLTNVVSVAAGYDHSLVLKSDGTVWAFGANADGQLGDGTTTNRTTAVQVVGLAGVTAIAAGNGFSLAVQRDGASGGLVWAWGRNNQGQLGDGSTLARSLPVRVIDLSDVAQVTAGQDFGVARMADGTVRAWGANANAQLGDLSGGFSTVARPVPAVSVVRSVSAGVRHALAVDGDGRVWGWGENLYAQLGTQNYSDEVGAGAAQLVPGSMAALGVAGGWQFTLALRGDGSVWSTGGSVANGQGGTQTNALTPIAGLSLASNAWLLSDADSDGLASWEEYAAGTDPLLGDTNGNGLSDLVDVRRGSQSANPDDDGDGVANGVETARGTDPFVADTDGDGVSDLLDAFPLDATRSQAPAPNPTDTTPPVITLTQPASARPIGGGGL